MCKVIENVNVAVVGAGFIADFHIQVLKDLPNVKIVAVCDVSEALASALAQKYGIAKFCTDPMEIIFGKLANRVHVLVPPPLHTEVAKPFLEAGIDVFLEKPMAVNTHECQILEAAANKGGARLCVNHNFAFHPAMLKAKELLSRGDFGNVRHVQYRWNVPLRQLNSRQFGHWMFREPINILLEQAVHPLSQISEFIGGISAASASVGSSVHIAPGKPFFDTWHISIMGQKGTAQMLFSVGQNFNSMGMEVICDDGQIRVDFRNNTCIAERNSKWPDFFDSFQTSLYLAGQLVKGGFRNIANFVFSIVGIMPRSDVFFITMQNSIRAFYEELGPQIIDAAKGSELIKACEDIYGSVGLLARPSSAKTLTFFEKGQTYDVVLIGGTGFIGKKLTELLVAQDKRVLVSARNIHNLGDVYYHPKVAVVSADIADSEKMEVVVAAAPVVVHLAHGGNFDTIKQAEKAAIAGTRHIAEACLKYKTKHLVHIGTIASLYLGNPTECIISTTPIDDKIEQRGVYSLAKACCEKVLNQLCHDKKLPVTILRPGVVVGEGGTPFHSGLGIFNHDNFCIGWNNGENPLPLVLVDDVAEAIVRTIDNRDKLLGKSFNVVGDVRLNGREYINELGRRMGRNLVYIPQHPIKFQFVEVCKWLVKVICQQRKVAFPSYRDLKSRGLVAQFDCSDFKEMTNWTPVQDRTLFIEKGLNVYVSCGGGR